MAVWDTSTPAGSEGISSGDDRIREFKTAVQDSLRAGAAEGTESIFPGSAPTTAPVYRYRGLKGATTSRPAAGQYGLYSDTTRKVLQRDSGSAWEDVATLIDAGTIMLFCQAAAPTGWTKITTQNDKALRIVSGTTGGTAGGTLGLSGGVTHSHTVASHVHAIPHKHGVPIMRNTSDGYVKVPSTAAGWNQGTVTSDQTYSSLSPAGGSTSSEEWYKSMDTDTANSSGATSTTDEQSPVIAYLDVIQASKD